MDPDDKKLTREKLKPERDKTDESLRTERKNTDQAIAEQRSDIEDDADQLVDRAREKADAVLDQARDKADQKIGGTQPKARPSAAVVQERAREDAALEGERNAADEILRREREAEARSLARLLPLEREKTDRYLLTERERSDGALANRDDFMGMVAHDLRNLLSGVLLSGETLTAGASDSDEGRRTVAGMKRVNRYVARMNRLIGDLVDVVSIDAGKLAMQPTQGDAGALVNEAVEAFLQTATERGLTLKADPVVGLIASFDHDRLLQVLANLITNAIKFTPKGGAIAVHGERVGDQIHLRVSDNGPGIPEGMLEKVFIRFWQVGKNDPRGLGLGLYISKCIVDAHGGKIWAESKLGEGSVIHFKIPCSAVVPSA